MALAATLGGMAFSNSSVCLVHGMSRPLGAVFHLPHGLSNAILLPTVTRFSWDANSRGYADVARSVGCAEPDDTDVKACANLVEWLEELNCVLEIPRLSQCRNVERAAFDTNLEKMAEDALASGSPANNPRVPSKMQVCELYTQAW
jgi:alcohol dehydrogenase class IV